MLGRGRIVPEMCGGILDCEIGLLLLRRLRRQDPNMRPAGQQQACSTGAAGGAHRAPRRVSWAMTNVELNVLDERHLLFTSAQLPISYSNATGSLPTFCRVRLCLSVSTKLKSFSCVLGVAFLEVEGSPVAEPLGTRADGGGFHRGHAVRGGWFE